MVENNKKSFLTEINIFAQTYRLKWVNDIVKQIYEYANDLYSQQKYMLDASHDQDMIEKEVIQYELPNSVSLADTQLSKLIKNEISKTNELKWLEESFDSIEKDLNSGLNRPLRIAILGEFSAGKSRLINAFLGEKKLLPEGKVPVTKMVTIIKYADQPKVILYNHLNEKIDATIDDFKKNVDQRSKDVNHNITKIELFYPLNTLRDIEIIDTPGFNSANEIHDQEAKRLALEADAIIWIFSGHQSGSHSEAQRITWINQTQGKIIAVLNKIDTIEEKDIDQQITRLKSLFGSSLYDVIGVSAKWIEEGKIEGGKQLFENLLEKLREDTKKSLREKIINTKLKYIVKSVFVYKRILKNDQTFLFNMVSEFENNKQKVIEDAVFLYEEISEFFKFSSKHHLLSNQSIDLKLLLKQNEFGLGDFFYSPIYFLLPNNTLNFSNHPIKRLFINFYLASKIDSFKDILLKFNSYFFNTKKSMNLYNIQFKNNKNIQINQILNQLFLVKFNILSSFIKNDEISIQDSIDYLNLVLIKEYERRIRSMIQNSLFSKVMYQTRFYRSTIYQNYPCDIQSKYVSNFELVHHMMNFFEEQRKQKKPLKTRISQMLKYINIFDEIFLKKEFDKIHFYEALDALNDIQKKYYKDLEDEVLLCISLLLMNHTLLNKTDYENFSKHFKQIPIKKIDFQQKLDDFWEPFIIPFINLKISKEKSPNQIFFIYCLMIEKNDIDLFTKSYIIKKLYDLAQKLKYVNNSFEFDKNLLNLIFFGKRISNSNQLKSYLTTTINQSISQSQTKAVAFINASVLFKTDTDMIENIIKSLNNKGLFMNLIVFWKNRKLDIPLKVRIHFISFPLSFILLLISFTFMFGFIIFKNHSKDQKNDHVQDSVIPQNDTKSQDQKRRRNKEKEKETQSKLAIMMPDPKEDQKEIFKFVKINTSLIEADKVTLTTEMSRDFIINHDFHISNQKISVKQYKQCVDARVCSLPDPYSEHNDCNWGNPDRENLPINCIDWKQARTFAKWVGGDLPSEAQWIYASRKLKADSDICIRLNHSRCDPTKETMWEWVLDEFHPSLDEKNIPHNESAWCNDPQCESQLWKDRLHCHYENFNATCFSNTSTTRVIDIGFRVIKN